MVVTGGLPSPKFHLYVHPAVGGTSVNVNAAVAVLLAPTHPSTETVRPPLAGQGGSVVTHGSTPSKVVWHAPSVHVASTWIGLLQLQPGLVETTATQCPAASTVAVTLVAPDPQSTVTLIWPVEHPVAVPFTSIPEGTVAPGGSVPTTDTIVRLHAITRSSRLPATAS